MSRSDEVARRIIAERKRQGLTRKDLVDACRSVGDPEFTCAMLVNIESGRPGENGKRRRDITIDELAVLAAALAIPESRLLGADGCITCQDTPPQGFACLTCGKETQ